MKLDCKCSHASLFATTTVPKAIHGNQTQQRKVILEAQYSLRPSLSHSRQHALSIAHDPLMALEHLSKPPPPPPQSTSNRLQPFATVNVHLHCCSSICQPLETTLHISLGPGVLLALPPGLFCHFLPSAPPCQRTPYPTTETKKYAFRYVLKWAKRKKKFPTPHPSARGPG